MNAKKSELRRHIRDILFAQDPDTRARESAAAVAALRERIGDRDPVAGFWPMAHEIDLRPLWIELASAGRTVYLPRCRTKTELSWHRFVAADELVPGPFGILEPDPASHPEIDLTDGTTIIVPGLAFTREGSRLGQGNGYYDRVLARADECSFDLIGVAFSCQRVDDVPMEEHDVSLPKVLLGGAFEGAIQDSSQDE